MHRSLVRKLTGLGLCLALVTVSTAQDGKDPAVARLMEQKLKHSQGLLAAVVKEDFPSMTTHADKLLELAKQQWIRNETPEYRAHLKDFWIVLEGVKDAAEKRSGDGATLAYVQLTLSCVKCHKSLRQPGM